LKHGSSEFPFLHLHFWLLHGIPEIATAFVSSLALSWKDASATTLARKFQMLAEAAEHATRSEVRTLNRRRSLVSYRLFELLRGCNGARDDGSPHLRDRK
jgi:hypothetical protein